MRRFNLLLQLKCSDKLLENTYLSRKFFRSCRAFLGSCRICLNNSRNSGYIIADFRHHLRLFYTRFGDIAYKQPAADMERKLIRSMSALLFVTYLCHSFHVY